METACLRHTELPNPSRLFLDFLYQYHRVENFYTSPLSDAYPEARRRDLVAALREQNTDEEALRKLATPGAVAVVTGQQVGLFSGPAYTIYKALTAARIAADLTAKGSVAVPVFWLASEDHDWPEIDHVWAFDSSQEPRKFQVEPDASGNIPVGTIRPKAWPIEELRAALAEFPFSDHTLQLVAETHTPGASMGEAFRALLQRILEPYGFLFLDPLDPAIRQLAAPVLREALLNGPELNRLLLNRNRELEAAGYHAQVHVDSKTSLLFYLQDGRRLPLREVKKTVEQLAASAEALSPNALLRPVVQDYMLPTAAYIGGPAEVAYFAQSQVLYERLLGRMPRVVSRSGFTLLDSRTTKLLSRYNLHVPDLFTPEQAFRERLASALVPAGLQTAFDQTVAETTEKLEALGKSITSLDPTLATALGKSRSKILYQLGKSRAKLARTLLRRDEQASAHATWLYNSLYPHKHVQERFYSFLPFLAQHGPSLTAKIYDNVHLDCTDHILLPV